MQGFNQKETDLNSQRIVYVDNTTQIKEAIVSAHRWGKCDINGASVKTDDGRIIAKPRNLGRAKRFVIRDGKATQIG